MDVLGVWPPTDQDNISGPTGGMNTMMGDGNSGMASCNMNNAMNMDLGLMEGGQMPF
jgi:hypothetical protein